MGFLGNVFHNLGEEAGLVTPYQSGTVGPDGKLRPGNGMMGANSPYRSGWDSLIKQLQARASGPSLAEKQTRDVAAQGMNQQVAMSHGRSAGAAREASLGGAQITQGLEGKAVEARLAEQKQNDAMLQNALSGASGNQYNYDALAQQKALADASRPTALMQLAGVASQVGGAAAGAGAFGKSAPQGQPQGGGPLPGNPTTLQGATYTDQGAGAMDGPPQDPYMDALTRRYNNPQYLTGQVKSPYGPQY
jgi:hypothetical protein